MGEFVTGLMDIGDGVGGEDGDFIGEIVGFVVGELLGSLLSSKVGHNDGDDEVSLCEDVDPHGVSLPPIMTVKFTSSGYGNERKSETECCSSSYRT